MDGFLVLKQKECKRGSHEVVLLYFFHWTQFNFKVSHDETDDLTKKNLWIVAKFISTSGSFVPKFLQFE